MQARMALEVQPAAVAQREALIQEFLAFARSQLDGAPQRATQLQSKAERAEEDLGMSREVLDELVLQHAGERREHIDQLRAQAGDLKVVLERAASAERRLLEEVDRSRQDSKQAK